MVRSALFTLFFWSALRAKFRVQRKCGIKKFWTSIFQQILKISQNPQTFIENILWFTFCEISSFLGSVSTLTYFWNIRKNWLKIENGQKHENQIFQNFQMKNWSKLLKKHWNLSNFFPIIEDGGNAFSGLLSDS